MTVGFDNSVWAESVLDHTPRAWNIGLAEWLSQPTTQAWASNAFKSVPPPFGSHGRRTMQQKVRIQENRIMSLLSQIHESREEVRKYHAILAPARLLPPEIMGEIFAQVCDQEFAFKIGITPDFPALRVCRSWRTLALNTARLWSRFNLACSAEALSKYSDKQLKDRVEQWIERAKGIPLFITSSTHVPVVWEVLLSKLPQWREWKMVPSPNRADGLKDMHMFFQHWGDATNLRLLSLNMQFYHGGESGYGPWDPNDYKPNINFPKLELLNLGVTPTLLLATINCPKVRDVTLNRASPEQIGLIPEHFPAVETLTLDGSGDDTNIDVEDGAVFDNLRMFSFSSSWRSPISASIFRAMPKLDEIRLGVMVTDAAKRGPFPSIKKLTIGPCNCSPEEARATFACFPNVQILKLDENASGASILKALTITKEEPDALLPKMRRLIMVKTTVERPPLFSFASVRAPAPRGKTSRKEPGPPLPFTKCTITMTKCTYQYTSLPDVENADWRSIKKLRSIT